MEKDPELFTLASAIRDGVDSRLKDLHTSMPGIVESFDSEKQIATVQPVIQRIFIELDGVEEIYTPENLPLLINVPVLMPRGGGFSITLPVKKGDECLLVFSERAIDNWFRTGKVGEPGARRFHDLSDAMAIVGPSSSVNPIENYSTDALELKSDSGTVSIKLNDDGSISITSSTGVDVAAPTVTVVGNLVVTGSISAPSIVVAGKELAGHGHIGSPTAPVGPITPTGVNL